VKHGRRLVRSFLFDFEDDDGWDLLADAHTKPGARSRRRP
jgi:hypothetical protein